MYRPYVDGSEGAGCGDKANPVSCLGCGLQSDGFSRRFPLWLVKCASESLVFSASARRRARASSPILTHTALE